MKKIGIITRTELLDGQYKLFCNETYINAIKKQNWLPVLCSNVELANEYANELDALLIPGGLDIDANYYNQENHASNQLYDKPIDLLDFTILHAFIQRKKPILGICRGIQIINVYFHGTLLQDITNHKMNHFHPIMFLPYSFLSSIKQTSIIVNSYHHQCIDQLGTGLKAIAWDDNQIIEAIIHERLPIVAVQWHPEKIKNDFIISYFLHACETSHFDFIQRNKK